MVEEKLVVKRHGSGIAAKARDSQPAALTACFDNSIFFFNYKILHLEHIKDFKKCILLFPGSRD